MRLHRMRRGLAPLLLGAALVSGCASLRDNAFLVHKVDGPAKSRAITEQGIVVYEVRVLGLQDYEALRDARTHFEVALRFDPGNTRARQYLETVDRFCESELTARTARAAELLKKGDRSEHESYSMLLNLRLAEALRNDDARVASLRAETRQARSALVGQLMDRARAAQAQAEEAAKPLEAPSPGKQAAPAKLAAPAKAATREQMLLEVKDQYDRIHAIHPDAPDLQRRRASVRADLDRIFADRADDVTASVDGGRFAEARDKTERLDALNRRLDYAHDDRIRDLTYRLNIQWARAAYGQKQLGLAEARVDAALRARRTDEAEALGESIRGEQRRAAAQSAASSGAQRAASATAANEAALREVQDLVRRDELVAASRRINTLLGAIDDRQTAAALREQQDAVRARLPDLYRRGVEAYRGEDFRRAVDLLSVVVEIEVGYEQASDYLDKARAKQKLLEGLQGNRG